MPTTLLLTSKHPEYDGVSPDYILMEDAFQGERIVKSRQFVYLEPTEGMLLDGAKQADGQGTANGRATSIGYQRYLGYLSRARFPEYVERAVGTLVGVLNKEEAKIALPGPMQEMLENSTRRGESLAMLLRRIHEHQLRFGRIGLLVDALAGRQTPILVDYRADQLINWDDEPFDTLAPHELRFAVLDESRFDLFRGEGLTWTHVSQARALVLARDGDPFFGTIDNLIEGDIRPEGGTYRTFTEREDTGRSVIMEPRLAGRPLPFIPFVVIGATDLALSPGTIPLLPLARSSFAIYRGSADYENAKHLQGQDTLVIIGHEGAAEDPDVPQSDQETRIGAGSRIELPQGGDAKFIVASPAALAELRQGLSDDKREAQEMGARLLNPQGAAAESGEALRIRIAASTATLTSIAKTAAFGLQTSLRQCAIWMGLDPFQVTVTPNLNFSEVRPETRSIGDLMDAKAKGAPISLRTVHRYAQDGDITKMTFEEEIEEIESEDPLVEEAEEAPPAEPQATPEFPEE